MLRSSSNRVYLLVAHKTHVTLNWKRLIAIARHSAASECIDAISRAAVSRRKQNARFLPSPTIHRGEYLARAIRKQNTRRASPDKRIRARSLFTCARVRMFSSGRLKYLAYFCWELIRAVIPASGCALKILSTNNPPAAHPFPSSPPAKGRAP